MTQRPYLDRSLHAILEEARLAEIRARSAQLRALRLAVPALDPLAPPARVKPTIKRQRPTPGATWEADIRNYLRHITKPGQPRFTLAQLYEYVDDLQALHPMALIDPRSAIRHTLQELRDAGEVTFMSPGVYWFNVQRTIH